MTIFEQFVVTNTHLADPETWDAMRTNGDRVTWADCLDNMGKQGAVLDALTWVETGKLLAVFRLPAD